MGVTLRAKKREGCERERQEKGGECQGGGGRNKGKAEKTKKRFRVLRQTEPKTEKRTRLVGVIEVKFVTTFGDGSDGAIVRSDFDEAEAFSV